MSASMQVLLSSGLIVRLTVRSPSSSPLAWIVPLTTNPVVPSTINAAIAGIFARAMNSSFAFIKWRRNWWNTCPPFPPYERTREGAR